MAHSPAAEDSSRLGAGSLGAAGRMRVAGRAAAGRAGAGRAGAEPYPEVRGGHVAQQACLVGQVQPLLGAQEPSPRGVAEAAEAEAAIVPTRWAQLGRTRAR